MGQKNKQKLAVNVENKAGEVAEGFEGWMDESDEAELLLDVYQDEKNIYIKSTIAGVEPDDIDIAVNHDMLTIRGQRSSETEVDEADYFYHECYWGNFSRSIILPVEVRTDKIEAEFKNGVLKITLPKMERQRSIPIKVKD